MKSSLRRALPDEVGEAVEKAILDKIRKKMLSACGMFVKVVRALEAEFGREDVHRAARGALHQRALRPSEEQRPAEEDLRTYLAGLEKSCAGTHEWRRVSEKPDDVAYEFTRCMWAEVFRELGASDIGIWICEGDDPAVRAYNPDLRCELTKTLMNGDKCCNHVFRVADRGEG